MIDVVVMEDGRAGATIDAGGPGQHPAGRARSARASRLPAGAAAELMAWLRSRDGDLLALRRAGRAAIVMPGLFAIAMEVIGNPTIGAFAVFGSFSMLLLTSFGGPIANRARSHIALGLAGAVFVVLGTVVSTVDWLAVLTTALVAFVVLFAGVISSTLASATTALLLAFILPVSLRGVAATIPDRLAGWGMATGAAVLAATLLWPSPALNTLHASASAACRAVAGRLRSHVTESRRDAERAGAASDRAVGALQRAFFATPYRPTGLSAATRVLVRLVDELAWLNVVVLASAPRRVRGAADSLVYTLKAAAATVLERGAELLESPDGEPDRLRSALGTLATALAEMERGATIELPVSCGRSGGDPSSRGRELVSELDPAFRAQELGFVVRQIGENIDAVAAAERRGWFARLIGHEPVRRSPALVSLHDRASAHLDRRSTWLHNSLRGGAALALAELVAVLVGAQHSFWVVLGALAVLRSNALATGQNVLRAMLGTAAGFAIGATLVAIIGTNTTALWLLLAPVVLVAGFAPAAISFAAGQAAFTVTLVILYNILQPAGWRVGLVRVEDVALGCGVSLVVGLVFWPRGAAAELGDGLARAYREGVSYLSAAVAFGIGCCDAPSPAVPAPEAAGARAAAAARRLDDTFRTYLAERGAKAIPLADVTRLMTGVVGLRLAADAILDLWERDDGEPRERAAARNELAAAATLLSDWYGRLGSALRRYTLVPEPLSHDRLLDERALLEVLDRDLSAGTHQASASGVRVIWTADHLDAVRRLQALLVEPARMVVERRAAEPPRAMLPRRLRGGLGAGVPRTAVADAGAEGERERARTTILRGKPG